MSYASPTPPNQAPRRACYEIERPPNNKQCENMLPPGSQTERDSNLVWRPLLSEPDFRKEEDSFGMD